MPPKKPDPKDFQFLEKHGERLVKEPGQINGYDFLVDGCEDCEIVILDHVAQIFVDYCKRCTLVLGVVATSAFFRNCEDCRFKVACGQLRTRECTDCDVLVLVPGQPIIETSKGMRFGPLLTAYPEFEAHMKASGLADRISTEHRCRWSEVYDFSPSNPPGGAHWSRLSRAQTEEVSAAFPATPNDVPILDLYPYNEFPEEDGKVVVVKEVVPTAAVPLVVAPVDANGVAGKSTTVMAQLGVSAAAGSRLLELLQPWQPSKLVANGADEIRAAVADGASFDHLEKSIGILTDLLKATDPNAAKISTGGSSASEVVCDDAKEAPNYYRELLAVLQSCVFRLKARQSSILQPLQIVRERLQGSELNSMAQCRIWIVAIGGAIPLAVDIADKIEVEGVGETCCIQTATVNQKPQIRIALKRM